MFTNGRLAAAGYLTKKLTRVTGGPGRHNIYVVSFTRFIGQILIVLFLNTGRSVEGKGRVHCSQEQKRRRRAGVNLFLLFLSGNGSGAEWPIWIFLNMKYTKQEIRLRQRTDPGQAPSKYYSFARTFHVGIVNNNVSLV